MANIKFITVVLPQGFTAIFFALSGAVGQKRERGLFYHSSLRSKREDVNESSFTKMRKTVSQKMAKNKSIHRRLTSGFLGARAFLPLARQ